MNILRTNSHVLYVAYYLHHFMKLSASEDVWLYLAVKQDESGFWTSRVGKSSEMEGLEEYRIVRIPTLEEQEIWTIHSFLSFVFRSGLHAQLGWHIYEYLLEDVDESILERMSEYHAESIGQAITPTQLREVRRRWNEDYSEHRLVSDQQEIFEVIVQEI